MKTSIKISIWLNKQVKRFIEEESRNNMKQIGLN